jgi:hypothetical protein
MVLSGGPFMRAALLFAALLSAGCYQQQRTTNLTAEDAAAFVEHVYGEIPGDQVCEADIVVNEDGSLFLDCAN